MGREVGRDAVKAAAAAADLVRRPRAGLVVLLYHRVGGSSGLEIDLPLARFEEQIAAIAGRAVPLDAALGLLAGPPPPGPPPVAVTFDDGTADFVDAAVPVLARHRVPAVCYVATAFVEEGRAFPAGGRPASWAGLADACSTGLVTVGSHTHRHRLLDRLPASEVAEELDRSIGVIAERLGSPPAHFAYPKALGPAPPAERLVRARFRSAALAGTRANRFGGATDPHRLARSPVQVSDGMRWFGRKLDGGMGLEDTLRRIANRRRYAGAVS